MDKHRIGLWSVMAILVVFLWAANGCARLRAGEGRSIAPAPTQLTTASPAPGTAQSAATAGPTVPGAGQTAPATRTASRTPAATPTPLPAATAVTPPATLALERTRPGELDPGIAFLGSIPAQAVSQAAWNARGDLLAYSYLQPGVGFLEVYRPADSMLLGHWVAAAGPWQFLWTPDGQGLVLGVDEEWEEPPLERLGIVRVQLTDMSRRVLAKGLDRGDTLDQWLDDRTVLIWSGCGATCLITSQLDVETGEASALPNRWPIPPDLLIMGMRFLFSADHRWLAAREYAIGPRSVVGPWGGPAGSDTMRPLGAGVNARYTDPQFWSGHALVFTAYPGPQPEEFPEPAPLDLYVWDARIGEDRLLAHGVLRAFLDPTGTRVAVLVSGTPELAPGGTLSVAGSSPHLALLRWPEWQVLGSWPSGAEVSYRCLHDETEAVIWSPDGGRLLFEPPEGGLACLDAEGRVTPVLSGRKVQWAAWGANGVLALLVDEGIWLLRVP